MFQADEFKKITFSDVCVGDVLCHDPLDINGQRLKVDGINAYPGGPEIQFEANVGWFKYPNDAITYRWENVVTASRSELKELVNG